MEVTAKGTACAVSLVLLRHSFLHTQASALVLQQKCQDVALVDEIFPSIDSEAVQSRDWGSRSYSGLKQ